MKIVFFDIDGVLNHEDAEPSPRATEPFMWPPLEKDKVTLLNRICDETGAKLVISSSWRTSHCLAWVNKLLALAGGTHKVIDLTPKNVDSYELSKRGKEVAEYLTYVDDVESFIALEDEMDMRPVEGRTIYTDPKVGLTIADADKAIRMLNGQNG